VGVPLREKLRVRLYAAIFVFLKKKHKGFPLPSFTRAWFSVADFFIK
jgi:hypothetical protein